MGATRGVRAQRGGGPNPEKGVAPKGGEPEGWGPERWGPRGVGGPKFRAFFPSPATHFRFFPLWGSSRVFFSLWWFSRVFFSLWGSSRVFFSLWGSSLGILVGFCWTGPSNVYVWALGLSCETPANCDTTVSAAPARQPAHVQSIASSTTCSQLTLTQQAGRTTRKWSRVQRPKLRHHGHTLRQRVPCTTARKYTNYRWRAPAQPFLKRDSDPAYRWSGAAHPLKVVEGLGSDSRTPASKRFL